MIEMQGVRLDVVGREDQVLHQPAIMVRFDSVGHLLRTDRGRRVRDRTNAADSLR